MKRKFGFRPDPSTAPAARAGPAPMTKPASRLAARRTAKQGFSPRFDDMETFYKIAPELSRIMPPATRPSGKSQAEKALIASTARK
ncbi:MAG: hypothetical protein WCR20_00550 [Verrucomicrobiota bacterium]|jgi:hypothetical protein